MDAKRGIMLGAVLIYGGTTITAAKSLSELQAKLSDTNKMLQVTFATSSQNINAAGLHTVQFPGQVAYSYYVKRIAEPLVMRNGAAVSSFTNVSSGQVFTT